MAITVSRASASTVSFTTPQEIVISHADDSIKIGDGVDLADVTTANALKTDSSHVTQPISVASLPLPSGAATSAKQDTGNTSLDNLDDKTVNDVSTDTQTVTTNGQIIAINTLGYNSLTVVFKSNVPADLGIFPGTISFFGYIDGTLMPAFHGCDTYVLDGELPSSTGWDSQFAFNIEGLSEVRFVYTGSTTSVDISYGLSKAPGVLYQIQAATYVNVGSSALPAGASTGTKQDTGNSSLSSIDGKITAVNTGAVVVSSSALPSGAATSGKQDTLQTAVDAINTKSLAAGQAAMAASSPVVIASNQSAIPASQSGTWNVGTVTTVTSLTQMNGAAIAMGTGTRSAGTQRVTIATDDVVPVTIATAPALVASSAIIGKVGIDQTTPGTTNGVQVNAALPAGNNNIGDVDIASGTITAVTSLTQMNGAAISMGTGTRDAGTQRVTIATNDVVPASQSGTWNVGTVTAVTAISNALPAGTALIGKVGIDQTTAGTTNAISVAQLGTTTIATGNGTASAGVQRVALVSDPTANTVAYNVNTNSLGRTELRFYAVAAASGSTGTETAITLTKSSGTAATTTANSFVVTTGKKFRINHISVATRGHATATIQTTTFNLRVNPAGGVGTSSTPIILSLRSATPATASAWDRYVLPIADGIEIPGDGTLQFGITAAATFTTNAPTWDVTITGYEY